MTTSLYLLLAVGWLVVAGVNLRNHAHWSSVVLDVVLCLVFAVLGVRKAIRAGGEENDDKKK